VGFAVVALFAVTVARGLEWGVPSARRARFEGASERARALEEGILRKSWEHWNTRGRRSEIGRDFERHLFNPLRSYHPDEYQVFKSLSHMDPKRLSLDPGSYIYPSLHTYLVGAALGAGSLVGVVRLERDLNHYFGHPDDLGRMYTVGRAVTLLAAVAMLLLTWRVGEAMGRGVGLAALLILAMTPALCVHSHNLTRDTCAAAATVLCFGACRQLMRTGTPKWYDLAGGAVALCVAFQYFAVVLWGMVAAAALLRWWRNRDAPRTVAAGLLVSLVVLLVVFFLTNPYHVLNLDKFLADFQSETTHVSSLWDRLASFGWATHVFRMLPWLVTWPLAVFLWFGLAAAVVRRRDEDWLLLVWVVLWAGVVGLDGRTYSRYYVPLLPALALLGARGLLWAGARLRSERIRLAVVSVVLVGVLVPAAAESWGWARLYVRDNVRTVAGEWIWETIAPGSSIGTTRWPWQFEVPVVDPSRYRLCVIEAGARGDPYDLATLGQLQPDYFVTSTLQCGKIARGGPVENHADRFWHYLLASGEAYREAARFEVNLEVFGRTAPVWQYPEDMQYVNPAVIVVERRLRRASLPSQGNGS
jgi:hypothetical protein